MHAILVKDLGQLFDLSSCRCSQSPNRDWAAGCRRFDGSVTRHARAKSGATAKGRTSSVFYRFTSRWWSAYSTFALMSDQEYEAGVAAAESALPQEVVYDLRLLNVLAHR